RQLGPIRGCRGGGRSSLIPLQPDFQPGQQGISRQGPQQDRTPTGDATTERARQGEQPSGQTPAQRPAHQGGMARRQPMLQQQGGSHQRQQQGQAQPPRQQRQQQH